MISNCFFFFNDTATTEIYTLSLHDALPICEARLALRAGVVLDVVERREMYRKHAGPLRPDDRLCIASPHPVAWHGDRKSTRLNSSHANISYAVFCLKKKNKIN